jgi:predicted transcriptional regulator
MAHHSTPSLQEMTAGIVCGYVEKNRVAPNDLPALIASIYASLSGIDLPAEPEIEAPKKLTPAMIRKSITPDALISFEDGRPSRMLKRHLSVLGLTPQGYREKWGLPIDYPVTAPSYSAARSALAKAAGLGGKGRGGAAKPVAAPVVAPKAAAKPRVTKAKATMRPVGAIDPSNDE